MNSKKFTIPVIMEQATPGDVVVIGGGSGEVGSDPVQAYSYHDWLNTPYAEDIFIDGVINEDDYALWWESNGFSREDWEDLNPGLSWDDYFD